MRLNIWGAAAYSILLMLIVIISGCMNYNTITSETQPPSESEMVTLKVVQSLSNPKRTEYLRLLIKQFESEHTHIRVKLITPEYDRADDTILTMLESEQEIDIVEVRDITVHNYASRGLILSLDPFLSWWEFYNQLSDNAKLMARDMDNAYYVPSSLYQSQLYYRKDWFDAKALQVPETWEELYFVGKQLTKPELGQYGYSSRGDKGAAIALSRIIQDYNGINVNPRDSMFRLDGTTIFSDPHAVEAVNLYRKIQTEISPPKSLEWGFNDQVKAFTSGQTAMLIQDSDVIEQLTVKLKEGTWATAPLPSGPDGISHSFIGSAGWGIALQSKHRDEAWSFISFLSSRDNNESFNKTTGAISIYNHELDDDFNTTGPYAPYTLMANNTDRFKVVKLPNQYVNYSKFLELAANRSQNYIKDEMTDQELLKQLDDFWIEQKLQ